jgi:glycosyltransferase involved in cell wall biosynthesis
MLVAKLASALVNYGARAFPRLALRIERMFTRALRARLTRFIKTSGAALVHVNNNPHRDLWAIEAAAAAGVPCVAHLRSFHGFGFSRQRAAAVNSSVAAFIAYSRSIADYWVAAGLSPDRMHVVPNAIGEVSAASVDLRATFGCVEAGPVVGLIGRVIPERGHARLIRALPALLKEFPGLILLLVGGGAEADIGSVNALADDLGVSANVIHAGHRSDALAIMAALDAIVLPYTIEPFGRTLLEAWQLGIPVVLSRVGHIADVVTDGHDALLFEPDVSDDLSAKLTRVLRDPALRAQLTANGRQTCIERFSIAGHCRRIEAVYREVLDQIPPGDRLRDRQSDTKSTVGTG